MRKIQIAILGAVMALAMFGGVALAAGPSNGTGPWVTGDGGTAIFCGGDEHAMYNMNSDKAHCFRN
jgi:hypothetical protein